jgi:hypothetical protein
MYKDWHIARLGTSNWNNLAANRLDYSTVNTILIEKNTHNIRKNSFNVIFEWKLTLN